MRAQLGLALRLAALTLLVLCSIPVVMKIFPRAHRGDDLRDPVALVDPWVCGVSAAAGRGLGLQPSRRSKRTRVRRPGRRLKRRRCRRFTDSRCRSRHCIALVAAAVATVAIGAYGVRLSRTTSDFLVASRTVGPRWNAAAISGEYLSAASFLGVAGLIAKYGADALWYPVGFTAGYLGLLLFVAAPLRRSGAYTVPDFAEFRLRLARGCARVAMLRRGRDLHPLPGAAVSRAPA